MSTKLQTDTVVRCLVIVYVSEINQTIFSPDFFFKKKHPARNLPSPLCKSLGQRES
jgi:hypothetical protein